MIGAIMDWDTYSLEKPKYLPQNSRKSEVADLRQGHSNPVLSKAITPSRSTDEYFRMIGEIKEVRSGCMGSAWRLISPIEAHHQILVDKSIYTELDEVKKQNESVLRVVSSLQEKVGALEAQIKNQTHTLEKTYNFEEIRKISEDNMQEIRTALDLPKINDGLSLKDRINKLDGFLREYSNDKENSVDLVNEVREDW
jgi:hypothetical protein